MTLTDLAAVFGGLAAGLLSGAIGIGGGLVFVPMLTIGFRVAQTVAQGTSLAAIVPTALVGGITHVRQGNANVAAAWWLGGAGVVGRSGARCWLCTSGAGSWLGCSGLSTSARRCCSCSGR